MIKFAIRDDDTCYWTSPEELESVYRQIWDDGYKVSLSVVPCSVRSLNQGSWEEFCQETEQRSIADNKELISFLREGIRKKQVSVMLHGFSHQYMVKAKGVPGLIVPTKENLSSLPRGNTLQWLGEYTWKGYDRLKKETLLGKELLEDELREKISVFVPPSNDISAEGVRAVSDCGLNISGSVLLRKFNRKFDRFGIKNWLLKFFWKRHYHDLYPFTMIYRNHCELAAFGLVPGVSAQSLLRSIQLCVDVDAPFVLSTHYWEVNKNPELNKQLREFMSRITLMRVVPSCLNDCMLPIRNKIHLNEK